jgi:hypothetical protein
MKWRLGDDLLLFTLQLESHRRLLNLRGTLTRIEVYRLQAGSTVSYHFRGVQGLRETHLLHAQGSRLDCCWGNPFVLITKHMEVVSMT